MSESEWVDRGVLDNEFLSPNLQAKVFTFQSTSPEGMCIALPRSSGNTIKLLGIICLGKQTSKACFWDNQRNKINYDIQKGDVKPLSEFAGGVELKDGTGGVCTECHAGENPYVIHPKTSLGVPALAGLPLFADRWYEPLVTPEWSQNPGPLNLAGACAACHTKGGPGGRFPELSFDLHEYCNTVLRQAIKRTMPPGAPGSLAGDPHPKSLLAMCEPPVEGPVLLAPVLIFLLT